MHMWINFIFISILYGFRIQVPELWLDQKNCCSICEGLNPETTEKYSTRSWLRTYRTEFTDYELREVRTFFLTADRAKLVEGYVQRHLRDRADSMEGWDTSHSVQQQRGLKHRERAPADGTPERGREDENWWPEGSCENCTASAWVLSAYGPPKKGPPEPEQKLLSTAAAFEQKKPLAPNALSIHFCIHQSHLLTTWCGYPQSVYSMLQNSERGSIWC